MMHVTVSTIDSVLYSNEAESISVPGVEGEMTILPHHVPLVTLLQKGVIKIRSHGEITEFPLTQGFIEVGTSEVVLLL